MAAIAGMLFLCHDALAYVALSGLVFFGWGEIFSLFPSTLTDTFGTRHAATNYRFLCLAQGIGSVLGGPVAAAIHEAQGSWLPVFGLIIAMDILAGVLAVLALRPLRRGLPMPIASRPAALRPDMPIAFMSGDTSDAGATGGRSDDGMTILWKPFRKHELAKMLHAVLTGRPA